MIDGRVLSPAERADVLPQLQTLLTADRFHARGILQSGDSIEQWHIEVDYPAAAWFAVNERGDVHEFRDGMTTHRGQSVERPTSFADELVGPLAAAVPARLPWWGERSHDFSPVMIEHLGTHSLLLTFEHGADSSMRATMVVDTTLGLVTRVLHFNAPYILLLDIEPGRPITRITPDAFPTPEVIYPEY